MFRKVSVRKGTPVPKSVLATRYAHSPADVPTSRFASLGLTDYLQLDMLGFPYKPIKSSTPKRPGSPSWCAQTDCDRAGISRDLGGGRVRGKTFQLCLGKTGLTMHESGPLQAAHLSRRKRPGELVD